MFITLLIIMVVIIQLAKVIQQVAHREFIELWDFLHCHFSYFHHHPGLNSLFIGRVKLSSF